MSSFAGVIGSIIAQMAKGTPIWKISAPAFIHTTQSSVEMGIVQLMNNGNCLESFNDIEECQNNMARIGKLLLGLISLHVEWSLEKPFNSIHGEFYHVIARSDAGNHYSMKCEQIWHHPPINSYLLQGPKFKMGPISGVDTSDGVKPGFNYLEFTPKATIRYSSQSYELDLIPFGFKLEGMLFGKKSFSTNGDFEISDKKTGVSFQGHISKGYKICGDFIDSNRVILDSVNGNLLDGVFYNSSKKLWIKGLDYQPLKLEIPPEAINDPLLSINVWAKTWEAMKKSPPDWSAADFEKKKVEDEQRKMKRWRKMGGTPFKSRFNFYCKYYDEKGSYDNISKSSLMSTTALDK